MTIATHLVVIGGLAIALAWKLYQLTRAPDDRALRAVVGTLAAVTASKVVGIAPVAGRLDALVAAGTATLGENILVALALFCSSSCFSTAAVPRALLRTWRCW